MRFGSVRSGIEAASVAWGPLGWKAAWFSEIKPFPSAVLRHHYPDTPNLGDMATLPARILAGEVEAPDIFCGGTPCQAFSVAGLRRSLDDARGNLSLTYCEIADAIDAVRSVRGQPASIVFWENVPGVLSTRDNAFGCFLGALAGSDSAIIPSGRWTGAGVVAGPKRTVAWRTLDAQYFGLAQRRKRVFVVASARNNFDPAAVLFEWKGVRRDYPPSRETRKIAPTIPSRSTGGGGLGTDFDCDGGVIPHDCNGVVNALTANNGQRNEVSDVVNSSVIPWPAEVNCTLNAAFGDKQGLEDQHALSGASLFVPAHAFDARQSDVVQYGDKSGPLDTDGHSVAVAYDDRNQAWNGDTHHTLRAEGVGSRVSDAVISVMQVRRLTPRECERLQGFPDDYTQISWRGKPADQCPDGPRYKALGNSWAVPVVRWIGWRIDAALIRPANDNRPQPARSEVA